MSARVRSPWLALGVIAAAMLTIGLDATIVNVALSPISRELGASTTELQWVTTSYALTLGALMIPFGALGDRLGRSRMLAGGLLAFALASLLCAFSPDPGTLVVGRVLLGAAAAAMVPLSMAVLPSLFPDAAERQKALGIWLAASALGLPLGPIVGGLLLQHFWWGSVFLVNVPLAGLGALAVIMLVPESRGSATARLDLLAVVLSAAGTGTLVYAFTAAGEHGWLSWQFGMALASAAALLAAFTVRTLRSAHPLVDLRLLRRRRFAIGTAMAAVTMVLLSGSMFGLTQLFSVSFGSDALSTGLRLLPLVGGLILGTRVGSRVIAAIGQRNAVVLFCLLVLAASVGQVFSVGASYWLFAVLMAVLGAGIGGIIPVSMFLAMGELSNADAGSGSALIQAIRQICSALGVALLGSVTASTYADRLDSVDLPTDVRGPVADSVTAGVQLLATTGHRELITPVVEAYGHGLAVAGGVAAVIALATLALAWFMPDATAPLAPVPAQAAGAADEPVDGSHLPGERVEQR